MVVQVFIYHTSLVMVSQQVYIAVLSKILDWIVQVSLHLKYTCLPFHSGVYFLYYIIVYITVLLPCYSNVL